MITGIESRFPDPPALSIYVGINHRATPTHNSADIETLLPIMSDDELNNVWKQTNTDVAPKLYSVGVCPSSLKTNIKVDDLDKTIGYARRYLIARSRGESVERWTPRARQSFEATASVLTILKELKPNACPKTGEWEEVVSLKNKLPILKRWIR
jgi:hypothetical protein